MTIDIKPIDPVSRAFFAGEVSGIDLTRRLSDAEVAAVHAGMDRFGVLVFHDQHLTDDQQLAFSRQLGPRKRRQRIPIPDCDIVNAVNTVTA